MINLIAMDVYDDSPTIVTIWLTIMPKISILILLLELCTQIIIINSDIISPIYNYNLLDSITSINFNNLDNGLGINSSISLYIKNLELGLGNNTINVVKILLLISSLLSLIIGTIVGLAQIKIKRLLAYSIWEIRLWA